MNYTKSISKYIRTAKLFHYKSSIFPFTTNNHEIKKLIPSNYGNNLFSNTNNNDNISHLIMYDTYNGDTSEWISLMESIINDNKIKEITLVTDLLMDNPSQFISGNDSNDLLRFIEKVTNKLKTFNIQTNICHPNQLNSKESKKAVLLLQIAGANIIGNTPILNNINNDGDILSELWIKQRSMNIISNDVYVNQNISKNEYFCIPFVKIHELYKNAYANISHHKLNDFVSLNGPYILCESGKILIDGIYNKDIIALQYTNSIDEDWCNEPFFVKYNPNATWIDQLIPYDSIYHKQFF